MINAMIHSHFETIQALGKNANLNREQLLKHEEEASVEFGVYKIRMEGCNFWEIKERVPLSGAQEWLYLRSGIPIFYWNRSHDGLMLI